MDSTVNTEQLVFQRQIGGNKGGALKKKAISKAGANRKNASIPSKYTTAFIERGRKNGFGSSTIRFNYLVESGSEIPGVGNYNLYNEQLWKDNLASQSRKGYGGFVSGVSRNLDDDLFLNTGPGPGQYKLKTAIKQVPPSKVNEYG